MILFPNAKINIGLNINEKRKDGYHNLETIFYPIGLADILEIQQSKENQSRFKNTGLQLRISKDNNLCFKAFQLIKKHYAIPELNFHLHKIIPYGGGLGGGSSDASFTLKALNQMFNLSIASETLKSMAEKIGSDCPFFIDNKPCLAWEKGNQTKPIDLPLKGMHLLLLIPNVQIDTKTAYQGIVPQKKEQSLEEIVRHEPIDHWYKFITNDFEKSLYPKYPELKNIKSLLIEKGALFASLSGSGSAIYGIFDKKPQWGKELKPYMSWSEVFH